MVYRYSVPWVIEKNTFLTLNDDPKCFLKKERDQLEGKYSAVFLSVREGQPPAADLSFG